METYLLTLVLVEVTCHPTTALEALRQCSWNYRAAIQRIKESYAPSESPPLVGSYEPYSTL